MIDISVGISALSLLISGIALYKNARFSKGQTEIEIRKMVSGAVNRLGKAKMSAAAFADTAPSDELTIEVLQALLCAKRSYISTFEEACSNHYSNGIHKDYLRDNYSHDIVEIFTEPQFEEAISRPNSYPKLRRYYKDNLK